MRDAMLERAALARAASQRLVAESRQLQERHRAWLRRVLRTDDGLVVALAEVRESVEKSRAARGEGVREAP